MMRVGTGGSVRTGRSTHHSALGGGEKPYAHSACVDRQSQRG